MEIFKIEFSIDNDAFAEEAGAEIARILRKCADQIDGLGKAAIPVKPLADINGNSIGFAFIEESE